MKKEKELQKFDVSAKAKAKAKAKGQAKTVPSGKRAKAASAPEVPADPSDDMDVSPVDAGATADDSVLFDVGANVITAAEVPIN